MVYRRRYRRTYRRPYRRYSRTYGRTKRRVYRRRRATRRINWYGRKYNFKEKFQLTTFTLRPFNTGGLVALGAAFTPNMLPSWGSRHIAYDQFKCYKWKIKFTPPAGAGINVYNEITANPTHGLSSCRQYLGYDYTDATVPATVASMRDATNVISRPWNRPISMIIRPRLLKMAYETGGTTGSAYMPSTGWIDVDDENTPHYGFKYLLDTTNFTADNPNTPYLLYTVNCTVYYGFKNVTRPGGV